MSSCPEMLVIWASLWGMNFWHCIVIFISQFFQMEKESRPSWFHNVFLPNLRVRATHIHHTYMTHRSAGVDPGCWRVYLHSSHLQATNAWAMRRVQADQSALLKQCHLSLSLSLSLSLISSQSGSCNNSVSEIQLSMEPKRRQTLKSWHQTHLNASRCLHLPMMEATQA